MNKAIISLIWVLALGTILASCTTPQPLGPMATEPINGAGFSRKADNFLIILDASESMEMPFNNHRKMDIATHIAEGFNQILPDQTYTAGLRSFGHAAAISNARTELVYGMDPYDQAGLSQEIAKINHGGGTSRLDLALSAASEDLSALPGRSVVVVISDGSGMGEQAIQAARQLYDQLDGRLCIYTVLVGDDPAGREELEQIAAVTPCGGFYTAEELMQPSNMSTFVKTAFLGQPLDSDGDGIADADDQCPDTPAQIAVNASGCPSDNDADGVADYMDKCPGTADGVQVDETGCALDSDKDGVADSRDRCPDTQARVEVDYYGCPIPAPTKSAVVSQAGTWIYKDVQFASGKSAVTQGSFAVLNEIANALKANPNLKVEIQGHTDGAGSVAFNTQLSQQRAQSVRQYLIDQGVAPDRLTAKGYGPERPIASNATAEGRAQNRRVELKPIR